METFKTLSIQKQTHLYSRLSAARLTSHLDKVKANWIIFGERLRNEHFERINFHTGYNNNIVDVWKVGHYQVALMEGDFFSEHEEILQSLELDYAPLNDLPDLSTPGLIVLDMDSTAITIECIDEIAKLAGVGDEVSELTERAMQGELDFEQSLRKRVAALTGADVSVLAKVRDELTLMPDLSSLIYTLHQFGWKTAIASGGFTYFSDHLKNTLNLNYARSNQLEIVDGKLTGGVLGEVVSAQTKADILHELAELYAVEAHNTVAVGDGANDLLMMEAAGLGIAYHAKPKVEQLAQTAVRYSGLGGVLCILSAALAKQKKISFQSKP